MNILREVSWQEFKSAWEIDHNQTTQERHPLPEDESSRDRLGAHGENQGQFLKYFLVELDKADVARLLLPHHDHTIAVPPQGMSVIEYGQQYTDIIYSRRNENDDCLKRISRAIEWFEGDRSKTLFMFISDHSELAIGGHFQGRETGFLYAGSSHKFAAYSVWINRNGFQPIVVYLATNS